MFLAISAFIMSFLRNLCSLFLTILRWIGYAFLFILSVNVVMYMRTGNLHLTQRRRDFAMMWEILTRRRPTPPNHEYTVIAAEDTYDDPRWILEDEDDIDRYSENNGEPQVENKPSDLILWIVFGILLTTLMVMLQTPPPSNTPNKPNRSSPATRASTSTSIHTPTSTSIFGCQHEMVTFPPCNHIIQPTTTVRITEISQETIYTSTQTIYTTSMEKLGRMSERQNETERGVGYGDLPAKVPGVRREIGEDLNWCATCQQWHCCELPY